MIGLRICLGLLGLSGIASALADEPTVVDIGSRRELFVDYYLVDKLDGVSLQLHRPRRVDKSLDYDKPWEGAHAGCPTILNDDDLLRIYYRGYRKDHPGLYYLDHRNEITCYAESRDGGLSWTKPDLGLFEVHGTKENNVILAELSPLSHNFTPFIDTRPGAPASERYKAVAGVGGGICVLASDDAIHWEKMKEKPVITQGAFDSQNVALWSSAEQCYVCYFRTMRVVPGCKPADGGAWRWISRSTSKDFLNWTEPVEMTIVDGQGRERPPEHYYLPWTMPYFRAPQIYVSLPKRFCPLRTPVPLEEGRTYLVEGAPDQYARHSSDSLFMTSRGGDRYDRIFMEAFIRPGSSPKDWITRANSCAYGIVPSGEREISIFRYTHYSQPTNHLARYTLRIDGFVSASGPYQGGELITKPLKFSGDKLVLNFETSAAGGIRVEIQDAEGKPIPGYTLDESNELIGNEIERAASWKNGDDVSRLSGKPVRLRFVIQDADLYALRFACGED